MIGAAAATDKGLVREQNQDSCCAMVAQSTYGTVGMGIVCDGVGGLAQGDAASTYVTECLATWFEQTIPTLMQSAGPSFGVAGLDVVWDTLLHNAHEELKARGREQGAPCGCTFTGVLVCGGAYLVAQVGDSRMYVVHDGTLERVTEDQTVAARLVREGELSAEEALASPAAHVVLQCIGAGRDVKPHFSQGSCNPRDLFVLCSDGVHGVLLDEELADVVCPAGAAVQQDLAATCEEALRLVRHRGAPDNATLVCLRADPLLSAAPPTLQVGDGAQW